MQEEILINATPQEVRIAFLENTVLQDIHIERRVRQGLIGNIYKGKVNRLLPGLQAAFVNMGLARSAFLHSSDIQSQHAEADKLDIRQQLKEGQELLVQVYKDPLGSKGARLTTFFTLSSRYLVLTPGLFQMAVSQKITDETERERLLTLLSPSEQGGYIFRTAAAGVAADILEKEKLFLATRWTEIMERAKSAKIGDLVYEDLPLVLRVLRDLAGHEVQRILVDDEQLVGQLKEFALLYIPALANRIEYYADNTPIFDQFGIEEELQKALARQVSLKSGAYLVFDQTEAMTTIDVNTGSYPGQMNLEQGILQTNLEAVKVIAHQVRLRNIGGMIIIDFIDMENPEHKIQLLSALKAVMAKDSVRTEISELTSLGLVQMTRKRTRESLEHILCVPCPCCEQRGWIKSSATVSYEIFRELKRAVQYYRGTGFCVKASADVVKFILEKEPLMWTDLQNKLGKPVKLSVETSYTQERFAILPLSDKE